MSIYDVQNRAERLLSDYKDLLNEAEEEYRDFERFIRATQAYVNEIGARIDALGEKQLTLTKIGEQNRSSTRAMLSTYQGSQKDIDVFEGTFRQLKQKSKELRLEVQKDLFRINDLRVPKMADELHVPQKTPVQAPEEESVHEEHWLLLAAESIEDERRAYQAVSQERQENQETRTPATERRTSTKKEKKRDY